MHGDNGHRAMPPNLAGSALSARAVEESDRIQISRVGGLLLLLVVIAAGDLVLIKATLDHVLRLEEQFSWLLSVGLTAAAVGLAFQAGADTNLARPGDRRARLRLVLLPLAWTVLGCVLFWLRWDAATFTAGSIDWGGSGDGTEGGEERRERLLAVVLAGVYVATGVLAWVDGQKITNPLASAYRAVRRRRGHLEPQLARRAARAARLGEHVELHRDMVARIDAERASAVGALESLAAELKSFARVQMSMHLGDPASTGIVRTRADSTHRSGRREEPADGSTTEQY